jgi:hypothetical protein
MAEEGRCVRACGKEGRRKMEAREREREREREEEEG